MPLMLKQELFMMLVRAVLPSWEEELAADALGFHRHPGAVFRKERP